MTSLELAHSAIGGTFFKKVEMPRLDVLVLPHEAFGELMGFRRDTVALARSPAGTIGSSGLIISRDDRGRPNTGEAVAHLLIAKAFPQAPLWFHEGFAGYARRVAYREGAGGQMACFGLPSGDKEPLVPLEKLVTHRLGRIRRRRGAQLVQAHRPDADRLHPPRVGRPEQGPHDAAGGGGGRRRVGPASAGRRVSERGAVGAGQQAEGTRRRRGGAGGAAARPGGACARCPRPSPPIARWTRRRRT